MKQGQASKTAEYVALFRAIETSRGAGRRLFDDRYAHLFLRPELRRLLYLARVPVLGDLFLTHSDKKWPGVRSAAVARTCYIDRALDVALRGGIRQVVILGAGYDCRAYRVPGINQCGVFEVDHPDTLARKREMLLKALPVIPAHVRQVASDFNAKSFAGEMEAAGFDGAQRTFFIWEGVTGYLWAEAVDAMLRWIASSAPGGELVFTYLHKRVLTEPEAFEGMEYVQKVLTESNEPWTFGIEPGELPAYLAERRLQLIEDLGADEFRARHLAGWSGGTNGYGFYRIALARIGGNTD